MNEKEVCKKQTSFLFQKKRENKRIEKLTTGT